MIKRLITWTALLGASLACAPSTPEETGDIRILVFSKTAAFRHASIEPGIAALTRLADEAGIALDATEDGNAFTPENLDHYGAVVFLSTTGDVLDESQQEALEAFVRGGGGFVGVHAASDTEYDWPWYGRLVGAYFDGHPGNPSVRPARLLVAEGYDVTEHGDSVEELLSAADSGMYAAKRSGCGAIGVACPVA